MPQPIVDQLLKKIAESHGDELIQVALPQADFEVINLSLDKEQIFKAPRVDSAIKIAADLREYLVHLEFQTEYDADIGKRMFKYAASLTIKYDLDVISILFQIKPPPKKVKQMNRYNVVLGGQVINSFKFHCVKLWEYRDAILSGDRKLMNFIPLLLELFPDPDESLLKKQRQLIQLEPDPKRRAELSLFCLAIGSKYFELNFLRKLFEEDITMIETLEELPFVGEKIKAALDKGMNEGIKKGMNEGKNEGLKEGVRSDILDILEVRFQSTNGIEQLVNSIDDVKKLKKILQLAVKADSLDSFRNLFFDIN